jgi:tripartite-type tricarboxylate transporter receptor subunit TctC
MGVRPRRWKKRSALIASLLSLSAITAYGAEALQYPTKPVRLIVPFAPGGGTDIVARVVAQKATEMTRQSVVVDNRGGAGGLIGTELAVRATPDGYTLGVVTASLPISAAFGRLTFDPTKDLTFITLLGETGYILALHPSVPARTTKELIAYAKANPGKITYGSSGTGGTAHLAGELLDLLAGTRMTHVPYKSSGPALTDLLGGQILMIYGSGPVMAPHASSGRIRLIAITSAKRSRAYPQVPTLAESGVPGYEAITWYALMGPTGLPRPIVARWEGFAREALQSREMKERFDADGLEIPELGPAHFAQVLARDTAKWTKVIKAAGIQLSN